MKGDAILLTMGM